MAESTSPLRVVEETPAYWRVVFDYPPFNVMDGTMFQSLQDLLANGQARPFASSCLKAQFLIFTLPTLT